MKRCSARHGCCHARRADQAVAGLTAAAQHCPVHRPAACHLQHGGLGLAWPLLAEPDGQIAIELALACLPAFALFLLAAASGMLKRRLAVLAVFGLCAAIAAYSAVNLLASAYGNTWTAGEILRGLFLAQLPQLGLARSGVDSAAGAAQPPTPLTTFCSCSAASSCLAERSSSRRKPSALFRLNSNTRSRPPSAIR